MTPIPSDWTHSDVLPKRTVRKERGKKDLKVKKPEHHQLPHRITVNISRGKSHWWYIPWTGGDDENNT